MIVPKIRNSYLENVIVEKNVFFHMYLSGLLNVCVKLFDAKIDKSSQSICATMM